MAPLFWDALSLGFTASALYGTTTASFNAWGTSRILNKGSMNWASGFRRRTLGVSVDEIILGVRVYWNGSNPASNWAGILSPYEGTTGHSSIGLNTSGTLDLRRGPLPTSPLLPGGATGVALAVGWNTVAMRQKIHDTAGTLRVVVNGATIYNSTGIDTRNGGTLGVASHVQVGSAANPGLSVGRLVEFYALDTTGAALNDIPASPLAVPFLQPRADGAFEMATPTGVGGTPSEHWSYVDDTTASGDLMALDFVNQDDIDTFILENVPTTAGVYGVMPHAMVTLTGAGSRLFRLVARGSDGTLSEGSDFTVAVSTTLGQEYGRPMLVDANGNPLTRGELAAMEFGLKRITATGTPNVRLGMLGLDVLMEEPVLPVIRQRWQAPAV